MSDEKKRSVEGLGAGRRRRLRGQAATPGEFDTFLNLDYTTTPVALQSVYRPENELMANAIRDLLEENGIPALVHSFQVPAMDGIAQVMRPVWGEVLVESEDAGRAAGLVKAFLATEPESPDPGTAGQDG